MAQVARLRFADRFAGDLDAALKAKGFVKADTARIAAHMAKRRWEAQPLAYANESVYVLNRNNGRPVFNVFVENESGRDSVSVLASNPREDQQGSMLTRQEQYFRRAYAAKSGEPAKLAEAAASELAGLAALKKYHRMQVHSHFGHRLDGSVPRDDGVSSIASSFRRALLHHVDVFAPTPHNSQEMVNNELMADFAREFGMVVPIATEITMPLRPDHPSGPHHLVLAADQKAARHITKDILRQRDKTLSMPSYYLGMTIDQMYEALDKLRSGNDAIVGIAHPVNYNSHTLPIGGVGLFSAVQHGHITMEQAMEYASRTDFVESWNDSLYMGQMSFQSEEFMRAMAELFSKHAAKLGVPAGMKLTSNLCNLLVAAELSERFGLGQSFGTDAHTEAPLERDYAVGGDWFSRGWTALTVPESMQQGRGLTAEEFVRGISRKQIKMGAIMFTEIADGIIRIVEARTKRPPELERIISKQAREVFATYASDLAKDFAHFLAHGEFGDIKRMSE